MSSLSSWRFLAAFLVLIGSACSGSSSSNSAANSSGTGTVDLLIADAPRDDLSAFEVTVLSVSFLRADNTETGNVLASEHTVDLLELSSQSAFLRSIQLPAGDFDAMRVVFDPNDISARDFVGEDVPLDVLTNEALAQFDEPLAVRAGQSRRILIHVNLLHSLQLDQSGTYLFTPVVEFLHRNGHDDALNSLHGVVAGKNNAANRLTLTVLHRDHDAELGTIPVQLTGDSALFNQSGKRLRPLEFINVVERGDRLAAYGVLLHDRIFVARLIVIEDPVRGVVSVGGVVTNIDLANQTLQLQPLRFGMGRRIALQILRHLGDPQEITVDINSTLILFDGPDAHVGTADEIQIGHRAAFDFQVFTDQPFKTRRIIVDDEGIRYHGQIVRDDLVPSEFDMKLNRLDVAIRAGLVDTSQTIVRVPVAGDATLALRVYGAPEIKATLLQKDLFVTALGDYQGPSDAPSVSANNLLVRPGGLDAVVRAIDRGSNSMTLEVERIHDPFGGDPLQTTVRAVMVGEVRVLGDAQDASELFDLFESLAPDELLHIQAHGLNDGSGDILVWEIRAMVSK